MEISYLKYHTKYPLGVSSDLKPINDALPVSLSTKDYFETLNILRFIKKQISIFILLNPRPTKSVTRRFQAVITRFSNFSSQRNKLRSFSFRFLHLGFPSESFFVFFFFLPRLRTLLPFMVIFESFQWRDAKSLNGFL